MSTCPVSSVRLVQTTEDTTLIYCVNLNMQISSSGAFIRALWIIMNVLQPGVMKVTHFLAMFCISGCIKFASIQLVRWYMTLGATWPESWQELMTPLRRWHGAIVFSIHQPAQCQAASFLPYTDMGRINCTQHTWSHVGGGSGTHPVHADLALQCAKMWAWAIDFYGCRYDMCAMYLCFCINWDWRLLHVQWVLAYVYICNSNPNF